VLHLRWRQWAPLKRLLLSTRLHGATSQMEAVSSSKTTATIYRTARCYITDGGSKLLWNDCYYLPDCTELHLRWRQWAPLKRLLLSTRLHGATSQMEAVRSSKTTATIYQTARCYIADGGSELLWNDCYHLPDCTVLHRRWRQWAPLKRLLSSTRLHGATSQMEAVSSSETTSIIYQSARCYIADGGSELVWNACYHLPDCTVLHRRWRQWARLKRLLSSTRLQGATSQMTAIFITSVVMVVLNIIKYSVLIVFTWYLYSYYRTSCG
jgi:hypothetical protein